MTTINPYLHFNGNAAEAFQFYRSYLGGEFATFQRYKEVPDLQGREKMSAQELDRMMHVSLPVGNNILMGSDIVESLGHNRVSGNNFYISIEAGSKEEAARMFNGLSAGGQVQMPLSDTFWGAHFGMFIDRFGIQWMVSYTYPQQ